MAITAWVAIASDLARCTHDHASEVRDEVTWCPHCGSLRLQFGGWFRPSAALAFGRLLGPEPVSLLAQRAHEHLRSRGAFVVELGELASTFGMSAVLELVQADLVTLDEEARVAAVRANGEEDGERASGVLRRAAAP